MATAQALDLERTLNPEQIAAVTHGDGPQLVLAGAGSGKTRVITYRIAWLGQERGVDPASIAAVTFTNKAAAEMRERVENLLQRYPLPTFVGTFHRFSLILLRRYGDRVGLPRDFVILDQNDQLDLMQKALAAEAIPETAFPPRTVLAAVSGAKNRLLGVEAYEAQAADYFTQRVARLYRRYQHLLAEAAGVDFDDMIAKAVEILTSHPEVGDRVRARLRHLLVDEYQDTNHAQLRLIRALAGAAGNLTAVGRRGPGDLPLARRRPGEHPGVREELPRRRGAQAGAQLPLDPDHPRRLRRGGGAQPRPARQAPVDRRRRRLEARALQGRRRAGRGALGGARRSRTCAGTTRSPSWPSWCAPTPRRGRWKRRCCARRCPTRWSAACASTSAPRSRT